MFDDEVEAVALNDNFEVVGRTWCDENGWNWTIDENGQFMNIKRQLELGETFAKVKEKVRLQLMALELRLTNQGDYAERNADKQKKAMALDFLTDLNRLEELADKLCNEYA